MFYLKYILRKKITFNENNSLKENIFLIYKSFLKVLHLVNLSLFEKIVLKFKQLGRHKILLVLLTNFSLAKIEQNKQL